MPEVEEHFLTIIILENCVMIVMNPRLNKREEALAVEKNDPNIKTNNKHEGNVRSARKQYE